MPIIDYKKIKTMRLFIAEKPDMGKKIASFLPGPHVSKNGYIETGGGLVTWCIGHVLEQVPPDYYDKKYGESPWKLEDLPIIPMKWSMKISDSKKKQVGVIKDLLTQCSEVINAGDPGREGQLIVDEVLEFYNNKKPVLRILLNSLDKGTVQRELNNLIDNGQFYQLYQAALGRQRADWLIGMNMTRAFTILGSKAGYRGVLSVGRVQTPTLWIVVQRDREIAGFVSKTYWSLHGIFFDPMMPDLSFQAQWVPPGASLEQMDAALRDKDDDAQDEDEDTTIIAVPTCSWLDAQHRIIDVNQAKSIADKVQAAKTGTVIQYINQPAEEHAPLPFELTGLQAIMNSKYGFSAQQTLDTCQALYEHGYTSYPRTDCSYLPTVLLPEVPEVLNAIASGVPSLTSFVSKADTSIVTQVWNDKKLGEHYALIPTKTAPDWDSLNAIEQKTYHMIANQYLAQFYPPCLVDKAKIEIEIAQEKFVARGRVVNSLGWRVLFQGEESATPQGNTLPALTTGQNVECSKVDVQTKQTTPPSHYNEGTLLKAMKHIHRLVSDPDEKKKLRAVEGIGRSATRASIIETLKKRGFINTTGKFLISSDMARILIDVLPKKIVDPGLTARWENILDSVAMGKIPLSTFMEKQGDWIHALMGIVHQTVLPVLPQSAISANKSPAKRTSSSGNKKVHPAGKKCSKCNIGTMQERTIKTGAKAGNKFMGCSNYPQCNHSEWPK